MSSPVDIENNTSDDGCQNHVHRFNDEWLKLFYTEVGREISLAYTTLNQMKNFAVIAVAALVGGVASISGLMATSPDKTLFYTGLFVGACATHLFVVRFFVRSILCYNNLIKWNILQADLVRLKLASTNPEKENRIFAKHLDQYYLNWHAPLPRTNQIVSNLKLGFGLLFVIPPPLIVWGLIQTWGEPFTMGVATLTLLGTLIEVRDFLGSGFFDNPDAAAKRKSHQKKFPRPTGRGEYVILWIIAVLCASLVGLIAEYWSPLTEWIVTVCSNPPHGIPGFLHF